MKARLATIEADNRALMDRIACLEDDRFFSIGREAQDIARRTEALLLAQEETFSARRQGADLSRTLTSDLLDLSDGFAEHTKPDGEAYTQGLLVLRDTPRQLARSRMASVEHVDLQQVAPGRPCGDSSPTHQRQTRRNRDRRAPKGKRKPGYLRREDEVVSPAVEVASSSASLPSLRLGTPIDSSDETSAETSSLSVRTTFAPKRNALAVSDDKTAQDLPSLKKRAVKAPPSPRPSADLSAEHEQLFAAFGIVDDKTTHEIPSLKKQAVQAPPSPRPSADLSAEHEQLFTAFGIGDNNLQRTESTESEHDEQIEVQPARQSRRPQRQAAVEAGRYVKKICEAYPIIYKSPTKFHKYRGRR
ncbi:hypothetical protein NLU13_3913 [Sarocladium strictum]|uniref:Uncharacterized protein n=1 Tax=Sarocladium strictum TaxID=5046 RepID=A0AA39GHX5_SARSR|nr:hypothetical protein NLU13_3913 [Sarocladium strictum]